VVVVDEDVPALDEVTGDGEKLGSIAELYARMRERSEFEEERVAIIVRDGIITLERFIADGRDEFAEVEAQALGDVVIEECLLKVEGSGARSIGGLDARHGLAGGDVNANADVVRSGRRAFEAKLGDVERQRIGFDVEHVKEVRAARKAFGGHRIV